MLCGRGIQHRLVNNSKMAYKLAYKLTQTASMLYKVPMETLTHIYIQLYFYWKLQMLTIHLHTEICYLAWFFFTAEKVQIMQQNNVTLTELVNNTLCGMLSKLCYVNMSKNARRVGSCSFSFKYVYHLVRRAQQHPHFTDDIIEEQYASNWCSHEKSVNGWFIQSLIW